VPDLQGLFLRGYGSQSHAQENGSTVGVTSTTHVSGALGSVQGDTIRNITATFSFKAGNPARSFEGASYPIAPGGQSHDNDGPSIEASGFDASRVVPIANEIRPVNTAVRFLIRALP
jgi:hypothetical protein